jgi:hypothetical protein
MDSLVTEQKEVAPPVERLEVEVEICVLQIAAIKAQCPTCKAEMWIVGPPFGPIETIQAIAQGKQLPAKCGKCGAQMMLLRSQITKASVVPRNAVPMQPRNRHEKRATMAGHQPMVMLK